MAATVSLLTNNTSTINPATTASVAPVSGRLIEVDVIASTTSGQTITSTHLAISGLSATWVLVGFQTYQSRRAIWRFRAESDGTSGTIEITYSGPGTFAEMGWIIKSWSGQVQGNNGADAVGNPVSSSTGSATSLTITITDTPSEGDATSVVSGIEASGETGSFEVGYTELASQVGTDNNIRQMLAAWRDAADINPTVSWSSTSGAGILANLIIAGVAGTDLVIADASHAVASDETALTQVHNLQIDSCVHSIVSNEVQLTQQHVLQVADALHAIQSTEIALSLSTNLNIDSGLHEISSDEVILVQQQTLSIDAATHTVQSEQFSLVQQHNLSIANSIHTLSSDTPTLSIGDIITPDERIIIVNGESRVVNVPSEQRAVIVLNESRVVNVSGESRIINV